MREFDISILKFHQKIKKRVTSREGSFLEFKESFNWNSKDKYGKTIAAFTNNRGGSLVFGIKNKPRELVGLQTKNFEELDESKIAEYLNSIFAPEIVFEKQVTLLKGVTIGILSIQEAKLKPVVSMKNDGEIKESEIYYRYNARSDKIKFPELRFMLEQEKNRVEDKWRTFLQNLGRIPDTANLLFTDNESGSLTRITDNPDAPLMRVAEDPTIGKYTLHYRDVISEMKKRSATFKANRKFIDLMHKLRQKSEFCRVRYLYPDNPLKGAKTSYFHVRVISELSKYYK